MLILSLDCDPREELEDNLPCESSVTAVYSFKAAFPWKVLERYQIHCVLFPENYTDTLQSLDVAPKKPIKDFTKAKFQKWYAEHVAIYKQLKDGEGTQPVDM